MTNPRMTVTFTEPQIDYLRKEAERLGITTGEMVRRIVDEHRDTHEPYDYDPGKEYGIGRDYWAKMDLLKSFAIAAAFVTLSSAQAKQTVEADNGAVYEILYTFRDATHAEAHILTPDNEQIAFQFDCHGHMIVVSGFDASSIRAIAPRSVAGRISQIACAGAKGLTPRS